MTGRTRRFAQAAFGAVLFVAGAALGARLAPTHPASPDLVVADSYRLERAYLVSAHVRTSEVSAVLGAVVDAVGLAYGKYDRVAFVDAPGTEQFRPREGAKSGAGDLVREPTTIVSFSVPLDVATLRRALDAIRDKHSYEEPVVYVQEVWRMRATGGDEKNPNRWWNRKQEARLRGSNGGGGIGVDSAGAAAR